MDLFPIISQNKSMVGFYEYLEIAEVWQSTEGTYRVPYQSLEEYTATEKEKCIKLYAIFGKRKDGLMVKLGEYSTLERARDVLNKEILASFGNSSFIGLPEK